jgi:hypothetical protein
MRVPLQFTQLAHSSTARRQAFLAGCSGFCRTTKAHWDQIARFLRPRNAAYFPQSPRPRIVILIALMLVFKEVKPESNVAMSRE